jgi:hypothetical protein
MFKTLSLGLCLTWFNSNTNTKELVEDFNCDIQEFITVQDPPAPPSNILHLPPLTSLHSATTRNMELPQPGEPRKVQPPSQRTLSRQLMRAWSLWQTNIATASITRMLEQLALRTPMTFHVTSEQDLNPRTSTVNDHPVVLTHEMMVIDPGEKPMLILTWKTTSFLSHIQSRCHEDRFPIPLWETWFCQSLDVTIPALLENPRQCPCRQFSFDPYGDHHTNGSCIYSVWQATCMYTCITYEHTCTHA